MEEYLAETPQIKQFKLTNDDEIICEVLQWDDEENRAVIIRAVMRIINIEDYHRGLRFFAFRPWILIVMILMPYKITKKIYNFTKNSFYKFVR